MLKIVAQKREVGAPLDLKKYIRGVIYGPHRKENILVSISSIPFKKIFQEAGTSQIISLEIDGETFDVMIKDFQLDPVLDNFIHVDFYEITKGEEVELFIPFSFVGEAPAIKSGNILNKVLSEVKVKSLPKNIPAEIEIDLSVLETTTDSIRLSDIKLPENVSFLTENLDEVIVSVSEAIEEIEEEKDDSAELEEVLAENNKEEKEE